MTISTYRVLVLRLPCIVSKILMQLFNGYRISVREDGRVPRCMVMMVLEQCECTNVRIIHLKMPQMVNFILCVFYHSKKLLQLEHFPPSIYATQPVHAVPPSYLFMLMSSLHRLSTASTVPLYSSFSSVSTLDN